MSSTPQGTQIEPPTPPDQSRGDEDGNISQHLLDTLNDVYRYSHDFAHTLEGLVDNAGKSMMMGEMETALAKEAVGLHKSLDAIMPRGSDPPGNLPLFVRRRLKRIHQQFHAWIIRWDWEALIGPDQLNYFEERVELWRRNKHIPWLEAMLTLSVLDEELDESGCAWADNASTLGLSPNPTWTIEEARQQAHERNARRLDDPALSDVRPSFTPEEMQRFRRSVRAIADFVGRLNWERLQAHSDNPPTASGSVENGAPTGLAPEQDNREEYQPASWFRTEMDIPPARLRKAVLPHRKSKKVRKKTVGDEIRYSVADVKRAWPDCVKPDSR